MSVKRMAYDTGHYLGVETAGSGGSVTESIYLLGVGIKSLNRSPAPKSTSVQYIHEKNATNTITGYDTSFNVSYDDIVDDDAVAALQSVAEEMKTGDETEFNYYRVDLLSQPDAQTATKHNAKKYRVACEPGDETNNAGELVSATCTLKAVGDFVAGTFDTSTKTFSAT